MTESKSRERLTLNPILCFKFDFIRFEDGHPHVVPGQVGAGHREVPVHQQHPRRPREEEQCQEGLHRLR